VRRCRWAKYLRFEDAPYIPGVLDKIISEARRDRAEYGFAQLRLVLCSCAWNNLKETNTNASIRRCFFLPLNSRKKKGVRDNYVLDPTTSEAEVNPALRASPQELYNLSLPEFVDLKELRWINSMKRSRRIFRPASRDDVQQDRSATD